MSNSTDSGSTFPDPDIAGPGVLIGFIATGLFATLGSVISALLSPIANMEEPSPPMEALLKRLTALSPRDAEDPVEFWTPIIEGLVLNLSDQQLISGLLLVILACVKYFSTGLSSLAIAGDLALFSMITHFATIPAIQKMLREHRKLAIARMVLVAITFLLWLTLSIRGIIIGGPVLFLTATILGVVWAFWGMCFSLVVTDLTLKARTAIGRRNYATAAQSQHIIEWLEHHQEDHDMPRGVIGYIIFAPKTGLSWLFGKFCQKYTTTNNSLLREICWVAAEILFPFRTGFFGFLVHGFVFAIGLITLAVDI